MKRISAAFCLLFLFLGLAHGAYFQAQTYLPAASGPVNMGGGPNMLERSLFSSNTPNLSPSQWYTPGSGSPAISTSDYYLMSGMTWSRPYDLDTMGSDGAAVKAANGGNRYVWVMMTDHSGNWPGSVDLMAGFSNDPQVWPDPTTVRTVHALSDVISVVDQNGYTQNGVISYQTPHLVYNPDPGALAPFYIYTEGLSTSSSRQHELMLITTPDFQTSTFLGPAIPTTNNNGWSSYGKPERLGVNSWEVYALGRLDGAGLGTQTLFVYRYTSADGWAWTPDYSTQRAPNMDGVAGPGPYYTISGQKYLLTIEKTATAAYVSLLAVNSSNVSLGTYTRISTAFGATGPLATVDVYPGPTYLQEVEGYEEDGIASIYVSRGFPVSNHDATNAGPFLNNSPSFYNIQGSITSNVLTVTSWPGGVPPLAAGFRTGFPTTNKAAIVAQLTGTGGAACPDPTCNGGVGTYSMQSTADVSAGTLAVFTNGGLWQQFIDQYFLITDATAAASAAPLGVKASCAAGVATAQWNNSLPHQNYRVYYGSSAGTQSTLVGNVTGTSVSFTPPANQQTWIKVVTMNVTEQKSRVVNVYCSAQNAQVNKHVNRVLNDGGSGVDITFTASADAWLTTNNLYPSIQWWTDVRFGYKLNGSGFIAKIYDLGTTYMPRGGDYTPTTSNTFPSTSSNTSYSASSFRGTTPSWINNASTARGYFGNGRANNVQRWKEVTFLAAYQKPGTSTATLFGLGEFQGLYLQHSSGSPGVINFAMGCNKIGSPFTFTTATATPSSSTAAAVIAGTYNNANLTAYYNGTPGSPQPCSLATNDTYMTVDTYLRGLFSQSAYSSSTGPVLASGSHDTRFTFTTNVYNFGNSESQFTGGGLAVFNKDIGSTAIGSWGTTFYN